MWVRITAGKGTGSPKYTHGLTVPFTTWYEQNNVKGPILLPNQDNSAVLANADESEEPTAAEQRAQDISTCGGVKLASLAGALFRNKDSKVGQQDTYQHFFQSRGQCVPRFPDTNNTRYQTHCAAAAELLIRQELYIGFLDWIRDSKDKPSFTNIEKNIRAGLTDVPTLTELAVLTLYAQAISHPYMHEVQGPGTEEVNMLDLGPLHQKVQKHME